ncbi:MAG: creatininase family protein [Eubacteriales bacterium]|nr:creatininase family protein [Eubacteriales bacterium]
MKLAYAFPRELNNAKDNNWPLVIPLGVIEYHGPHCAYGCDSLVPEKLLEELEGRNKEMVLAPTFWYGPASYAVAPAKTGASINVDYDGFKKMFEGIFESLLRNGFRNIYVVYFHQSEALLPMALSVMLAGKAVIFKFMQEEYGEGWWGNGTNSNFYESMNDIKHPWNWIKVIAPMDEKIRNEFGMDHAGKWECSILKSLSNDAVDLSRLVESDEWFIQTAKEASVELGNAMRSSMLEFLNRTIV